MPRKKNSPEQTPELKLAQVIEIDVPDELVALGARRFFGGEKLPPGAEKVEERVLARYVTPGATRIQHGVVPIGEIRLPVGQILPELDDDSDSVEVLPFRFNWASTSFALRYADRFYAVVKLIQPQQVTAGILAVIHFGENRNYDSCFGTIKKVGLSFVTIETPQGERIDVGHADIHFIGKISYWWMDKAPGEMWVLDEAA